MQLEISFDHHPSDAVLEEYALSRLAESALETVEEHLLVCELCQDVMSQTDEYVRLMKLALPVTSPSKRVHHFGFVAIPAIGIAALLAFLIVPKTESPAANPIQLVAMRGGDGIYMASAHAGLMNLEIDASDLDIDGQLRVEVVDGVGRRLWTSAGITFKGKVSVKPSLQRAGMYWVRLYSTSGDLLREFGLKVD